MVQPVDSFKDVVQPKSDSELLKMIYEFDTWSPALLLAVEKELGRRNILPADINARRQKVVETEEAMLSKGKEASLVGQLVGWVTVFGLLGVFIGYNYAFSKVNSKYTEQIYFKYNENSRKNGTYLFYCSLVLSGFGIIYKLSH
jgi:hypothetical protein